MYTKLKFWIFILFSQGTAVIWAICPPPSNPWEAVAKRRPPPEAFMSTPELIARMRYPVETYQVLTPDGYILKIFRIPHSNKRTYKKVAKEPVLIQHGLVLSSDDWFVLEPNSNLPFILSDLGFDVWLGNVRGNSYSQRHVSYTTDDLEYWDFSFHEMGIYDLPAIMKFILAKTRKKKMSYVGHSMGTIMFFIAMARHPELQTKVRKMVAMAPPAYVYRSISPWRLLSLIPTPAFSKLTDTFGKGRFFTPKFNNWMNDKGPFMCAGHIPACLCQDVVFLMIGFDRAQCSPRTTAIVAAHTPNPTSGKTVIHFLQWTWSKRLQEFNYGHAKNMKIYGTPKPPIYSISANHVDTLVMYAQNDWLVRPKDAERLILELGNATGKKVRLDKFNHMDFLYANDAKTLVYNHCIDFLLS